MNAMMSAEEIGRMVEEAARLPTVEYVLRRGELAGALGLGLGHLDNAVKDARRALREADGTKDLKAPDGGLPAANTEEALALRFADQYGDEWRYVAAEGRWYGYDGRRWLPDVTLKVLDLVRALCRGAAGNCHDLKLRRAMATAKFAAAVEKLARADRRHAATAHIWDADPWLLNTPGGVVDLRTGSLRPHDPADLMTRMTAVTPDDKRSKEVWLDFLDRVTDGDRQLQAYLQRVCGYALTGDTSCQALFFLHGAGANGKSVFLATIGGLMGDYHRTAPIETFTASRHERHPTELAGLRGARLVTATETEEGRRWDESKIKALTGGDVVSARFMRQDFFEFTPQFKLAIGGNHQPGLRTVDEAMRRRFQKIPFDVTIPPSERDPKLAEKLKAMWPAILHWQIEGCLAWQRDGLQPPAAVIGASEEYFEEEDVFSQWLSECCEDATGVFTAGATAFGSWEDYARERNEYPGSSRKFAQEMKRRGYEAVRDSTGTRRGFKGIRVKPPGAALAALGEAMANVRQLRSKAPPSGS